jgi:hypothetical protein
MLPEKIYYEFTESDSFDSSDSFKSSQDCKSPHHLLFYFPPFQGFVGDSFTCRQQQDPDPSKGSPLFVAFSLSLYYCI